MSFDLPISINRRGLYFVHATLIINSINFHNIITYRLLINCFDIDILEGTCQIIIKCVRTRRGRPFQSAQWIAPRRTSVRIKPVNLFPQMQRPILAVTQNFLTRS